ncbi:hypothetical protein BH10BAC5_BH10BAC5_06510 [soil metagenome]
MVHGKKGRKLGRTASHRAATLANLAIALIMNKRIETTLAKAKELRTYIEPLVTKAKRAIKFNDSQIEKGVHLRRVARAYLNNKEAVSVLFDEIGPMVAERNGGYTRILKTGHRPGDGGDKAIIEFVDVDHVKIMEDRAAEKDKKNNLKADKKAEKTKEEEVKEKPVKEKKVKEKKAKA